MEMSEIFITKGLLYYLIQCTFPAVLICVFLLIFLVTFRTFDSRTSNCFIATVIMVILLLGANATELYFASLPEPHIMRSIMSVFGYSLRPAVAYMVILIAKRRGEKYMVICGIPLTLNFILCVVSCFNGIVFSYSADNQFVRGTLGYLPFIISAFYILYMAVQIVTQYRERAVSESVIIFAIVFMSIFSTIMESVFKYKFILDGTLAISVTFYYLYLHTQVYKRDTLTNLLNRRCFYLDARKSVNSRFGIISIDLNHLKIINDTEGHAAGDKAICTMVDCVVENMGKYCTMYRTGGDEFMILCTKSAAEKTNDIMENIQRGMAKTDYSLSCGAAVYNPGDDFEKICSKSDAAMYNMKLHMNAVRQK